MSHEKQRLLKHDSSLVCKFAEYYGTTEGFYLIPPEQRITYTWKDLNVFVTQIHKSRNPFTKTQAEQKHILKNVSGVAYPGELLAILGPSGAGKTTLLNSLTFRSCSNTILTGLRCTNEIPLSHSSLTSQSSYVQQDDLFFANLTVREHLIFHALVRMDKHIPYAQRLKRVNEVISELSLIKCQNSRIGIPGDGISGGERKRLAFAAEVLTNPSLMFCDEPTSGLDSFMALNVMQVLKKLAQSGRTIICTIHQPSSELYAMFDKVLFMSQGRIAFLGTPDEADLFFNSINAPCPRNYNPADYYMQLLALMPGEEESCKQAITMICNNYDKSQYGAAIAAATTYLMKTELSYNDFWTGYERDPCPYKAPIRSQFRAVLWRSWLAVRKEPLYFKVRLLQSIMISIVISIIFYKQELTQSGIMNINGALFIFLTTLTFQNVFVVVTVFCSEFPIFIREHTNGMYRTDIYFICKTLADLPIFILFPLLYVCICYYLIGLNPDIIRFLIAIGVNILATQVAISFGYLISCIATSQSMALSIGPPIIIPLLLFGGFFLNIHSIPIYFKWLSYFSWFRYGFEALMINQWSDVNNITCSGDVASCIRNGNVVLEIYNFTKDDFTSDIIMLFLQIIVFRLCAYFVLLWRTFKRE